MSAVLRSHRRSRGFSLKTFTRETSAAISAEDLPRALAPRAFSRAPKLLGLQTMASQPAGSGFVRCAAGSRSESCLADFGLSASDADFLSAGIDSLGGDDSDERLRRLLTKLDSGQAITITAIGSSVTNEFGGAIGFHQQGADIRTWGKAGHCRGSCMEKGWLVRFFYWVNATWPHPGHRLVNAGRAATPISSYALCTAQAIEPTADLVIIEPISTCHRGDGVTPSGTRRMEAEPCTRLYASSPPSARPIHNLT